MDTFHEFQHFFENVDKIHFLDFTAKRITLKWLNLPKLCKIILKQLFPAYPATWLALLWVFWVMLKMIYKKVDFDPILTQKRVILTPIMGVRGQITKISPKMDSLTQKNICLDVSHLDLETVDFIIFFFFKIVRRNQEK